MMATGYTTKSKVLLGGFAVALVVCVCAMTAASALATEPYIKAENSKGEVTTLAEGETRTVTAAMLNAGAMHIHELNISISCTGASGSGKVFNRYESKSLREGRLESGKMTFEGCSVVEAPACYIDGAIGGAGKITTNAVAGRLGYQPGSSENVEGALYPEEAGGKFATIDITECGIEGAYPIKGMLVAGIGPTDTFLERTVQGVTALEGIQEFKSIEFPAAGEKLESQELKFGAHPASIEGEMEFVAPSGEKLGVFI